MNGWEALVAVVAVLVFGAVTLAGLALAGGTQ